MAKVMMSSGHGTDYVFMTGLQIEEAEAIIEQHDGFFTDENEFVWELYIED